MRDYEISTELSDVLKYIEEEVLETASNIDRQDKNIRRAQELPKELFQCLYKYFYHLKGTGYLVQYNDYKPLWSKANVVYRTNKEPYLAVGKVVDIEDMLDDIPEEIAEQLLFHINLFLEDKDGEITTS